MEGFKLDKKKLSSAVKNAMKHSDKLGAGAAKRKSLKPKDKVETVMHEYGAGKLHSGSGAKVSSRKQAIAIAMSEAGKARNK